MIKLIFSFLKLCLIASVVLVLGQIKYENKRISDYVWDITHSALIQKPILWISKRVVFHEKAWMKSKKAKTSAIENGPDAPDLNETEQSADQDSMQRGVLSGFLKESNH
jgi:hypothetical protein